MPFVSLDMEFYNSNEKDMRVVAACLHSSEFNYKYNLLDEAELGKFKHALHTLWTKNYTILSYAAGAEARGLLSLGIDPMQFQWIDLYVEFVMLCNSNNRFKYGSYLDKEGQERFSHPLDPDNTEDNKDHTETPKNLLNALYKFGIQDTEVKYKDEMRDLILSKNDSLIQDRMEEILEYCMSDTIKLEYLYDAITSEFSKRGLSEYHNDMLSRGRYAAATAICERNGIPIDVGLLSRIIEKTPEILDSYKEDVNKIFPFFVAATQKPPKTFKNGKVFHYKPEPARKDMGSYQRYIETLTIPGFPTTETGKFKSDKATLEEWGYWGGLEALWKYNLTESSLKWFNKDNKNGFYERLGSDNHVRPYYGIFGTQTGRNAARAKTFPLAMSNWLRAIIKPVNGTSIIACDFSQQEIYVAAVLSGDIELLDAYNSGDVYLAFAKQAGLAPQEATKKTHSDIRNLCKSTVLGLQFGMGKDKLRTKLRLDSGKEVPMEKTLELIDAHKQTYWRYWQWIKEVSYDYKEGNPLSTNDGWILWQDNPVMTSVRNFLVQGNSASITRLAIVMATEAGLKVMCGLHDAIYVISNNPEEDTKALEVIMKTATKTILKEKFTRIRIDSKVISSDKPWVEEKGEKDWEKLKRFLVQ